MSSSPVRTNRTYRTERTPEESELLLAVVKRQVAEDGPAPEIKGWGTIRYYVASLVKACCFSELTCVGFRSVEGARSCVGRRVDAAIGDSRKAIALIWDSAQECEIPYDPMDGVAVEHRET